MTFVTQLRKTPEFRLLERKRPCSSSPTTATDLKPDRIKQFSWDSLVP